MRLLILAFAVLYPWAALAGDGPWSAPNWHLGATEQHGPFVSTTSMFVSPGKGGHDEVDLTCTVQDVRTPTVRPKVVWWSAQAKLAQGLWCGDGGDLGSWCVALEHGATLRWYDRTPCAGGAGQILDGRLKC